MRRLASRRSETFHHQPLNVACKIFIFFYACKFFLTLNLSKVASL